MPIFRSRHQAELLTQLLLPPDTEFTLSELARILGAPLTTVQGEVQRLTVVQLIRDRKQGRNRLVSANPSNPATAPLTQLVMVSFGPVQVIGEEFAIEGAEQVIIFGSWAARYAEQPGRPPSDIDVLVIGTAGELAVFSAADRAQRRIGTAVNPVRYTPAQWADPGDWTLLIEIQQRPYTVVYQRDEGAA